LPLLPDLVALDLYAPGSPPPLLRAVLSACGRSPDQIVVGNTTPPANLPELLTTLAPNLKHLYFICDKVLNGGITPVHAVMDLPALETLSFVTIPREVVLGVT
jgi:hypothetical protein